MSSFPLFFSYQLCKGANILTQKISLRHKSPERQRQFKANEPSLSLAPVCLFLVLRAEMPLKQNLSFAPQYRSLLENKCDFSNIKTSLFIWQKPPRLAHKRKINNSHPEKATALPVFFNQAKWLLKSKGREGWKPSPLSKWSQVFWHV